MSERSEPDPTRSRSDEERSTGERSNKSAPEAKKNEARAQRVDARIFALGLARMSDSLGNSFLIVVLPPFLASQAIALEPLTRHRVLGLQVTQDLLIGFVLALFGLFSSTLQPFAGALSDRAQRRRAFIIGGLIVLGVASIGYAFATTYAQILLLRLLQGVGAALTLPATVALINELSTPATRGGSFGVFNAFRLFGFGVGPLVAGALVEQGPYKISNLGTLSGFDAAFLVTLLSALVSAAVVGVFVRDPERIARTAQRTVILPDRPGPGLMNPLLALGVAVFVMAAGIGVFATLGPRINSRLDQGAFLFGAQFAAVPAVNVLLQIPIGRWSDRFGRKGFLAVGFALLIPSLLAQGWADSSLAMFTARAAQGIAVAMVFGPALALGGDLVDAENAGTQLGILTFGFGLGVAMGPLLSGLVVRLGFAVPFVCGAALAVVGLVTVLTQVPETVRRKPATQA